MEAHVHWPDEIDQCPVFVEVGASVDEILKPAFLKVHIKTSNLKALGIVIDADDKPEARYRSLKACLKEFPGLPDSLAAGGVVTENSDGKRLGIWVMPDNHSVGCLETFLRYLVPDQSEPLWVQATASVTASREAGAPFRDVHRPKANLYTWLAWQDPPTQHPGVALKRKMLSPYSANAKPFVDWFRSLYKL